MTESSGRACRRCGYRGDGPAPFCRRCGLPFGAAPIAAEGDWPPECPVCYEAADRSGSFPDGHGGRTSYERHAYAHELRPVGDDEWLETLREGDDIVVGRWRAPYDLTRRYLVTGQWDGGRNREYVHSAVVLAMAGASRAAAPSVRSRGAAGPGAGVPPDVTTQSTPVEGPSATASPGNIEEAQQAVEELREHFLRGSRA